MDSGAGGAAEAVFPVGTSLFSLSSTESGIGKGLEGVCSVLF